MDLEKEVQSLVVVAEQYVSIKTADDMAKAVETLSQMNKFVDRVTEEKEKVIKPLNEALKAERARWKPIETMYEKGIAILRKAIGEYQMEQEKKRKEEEAKIAARIGEGRGKLKIETAVAKIGALEAVEDSVATDSGMVKFRTDKKLEIVDEKRIPRDFLMVDERKVIEALKAGKVVPGAKLVEVKTVVNFR